MNNELLGAHTVLQKDAGYPFFVARSAYSIAGFKMEDIRWNMENGNDELKKQR